MLVTPGVKGSKLELTVKFNIQRGRFTTKKHNDSDNNYYPFFFTANQPTQGSRILQACRTILPHCE